MNPIANIKAVLPKYKGRPFSFTKEFGECSKYCGWRNKRLQLIGSPPQSTTKPNARKERIFVPTRNEAVSKYRLWLRQSPLWRRSKSKKTI